MNFYTRLFFIAATLVLAHPLFAFQSPLSDEALREAYFLGQRHDGSLERLIEQSTRRFPVAKNGVFVSSVTFVTPFLKVAQLSNDHPGGYSAQQALLDHRNDGPETVSISIEVQLGDSVSDLSSDTTGDLRARKLPLDKSQRSLLDQVHARIYDGSQPRTVSHRYKRVKSRCGSHGPCVITGATLEFSLPAQFTSDSAKVTIALPGADEINADFDLASLR